MDVVIVTHPAGQYIDILVPPPGWSRRCELSIAEVIEPSTFRARASGVLYSSPPALRLNACANAIDWAGRNGHRVLGGHEARTAIGVSDGN